MTAKTHKRTLLALALVGTLAAQSALACKAPAAPRSLPDGRSADTQQMQDAKRQVEQYNEQVSAYFKCENDALKLLEVSEEQKAVVKGFNAEVRAFRSVYMVAAARPAG
jgi:Ni/Co efflux regulator RcnB